MLIKSEELFENLKKPNLNLIDTRPFKEYSIEHIPGSVNLDLFSFHWFDTSKEGLDAFEIEMRKLLSFVGISNQSKVVFYDEISGMGASRGVWLLQYLSHTQTYMLDGGIRKWKQKGFPLEKKTNGFVPTTFVGKSNNDLVVGFEYIIKNIDRIRIIDTRSKEEFDGTIIRAARGGHIPNAINIDWKNNLNEDGTMKDNQLLFELYQHFSKDSEIVVYCQGGYRAANSFVALKKLGFDKIKLYLGSWGEWGNRLELPVA